MFQGLREICSFKLSIVSVLTDLDCSSRWWSWKKKKERKKEKKFLQTAAFVASCFFLGFFSGFFLSTTVFVVLKSVGVLGLISLLELTGVKNIICRGCKRVRPLTVLKNVSLYIFFFFLFFFLLFFFFCSFSFVLFEVANSVRVCQCVAGTSRGAVFVILVCQADCPPLHVSQLVNIILFWQAGVPDYSTVYLNKVEGNSWEPAWRSGKALGW